MTDKEKAYELVKAEILANREHQKAYLLLISEYTIAAMRAEDETFLEWKKCVEATTDFILEDEANRRFLVLGAYDAFTV